jgi:hypothetical protein
MLNTSGSIMLAILLLQLIPTSVVAKPGSQKDQRLALVKKDIEKRGVGEKARVTIKTVDGKTINGFIEETGPDSFSLREAGAWKTEVISYSSVKEVKGKGLSVSQKILIGLGVMCVISFILFPEGKD